MEFLYHIFYNFQNLMGKIESKSEFITLVFQNYKLDRLIGRDCKNALKTCTLFYDEITNTIKRTWTIHEHQLKQLLVISISLMSKSLFLWKMWNYSLVSFSQTCTFARYQKIAEIMFFNYLYRISGRSPSLYWMAVLEATNDSNG